MFDTREYLESLAPPEFIAADGTRYVGHVLSMPQWQRFEPRVAQARERQLAWPALQRLILDLCAAFFPRGRNVLSRRFWHPVAWHVGRLPPVGQMRALWDFMRSQARASGVALPESPGTPISSPQPLPPTLEMAPTPPSAGSSVAG